MLDHHLRILNVVYSSINIEMDSAGLNNPILCSWISKDFWARKLCTIIFGSWDLSCHVTHKQIRENRLQACSAICGGIFFFFWVNLCGRIIYWCPREQLHKSGNLNMWLIMENQLDWFQDENRLRDLSISAVAKSVWGHFLYWKGHVMAQDIWWILRYRIWTSP